MSKTYETVSGKRKRVTHPRIEKEDRYGLREVLKEERLGAIQRGASNILAGRTFFGRIAPKGGFAQ